MPGAASTTGSTGPASAASLPSSSLDAPAVPKTPGSTRNKSLKLPRNALLGLWGSGHLDDLAKPRWRYLTSGTPAPSDPQLILNVS